VGCRREAVTVKQIEGRTAVWTGAEEQPTVTRFRESAADQLRSVEAHRARTAREGSLDAAEEAAERRALGVGAKEALADLDRGVDPESKEISDVRVQKRKTQQLT
jgi:hypothetical protein